MSKRTYQVCENSLCRAARRQGLRLEKSHLRDPRGEYGTYALVESPPPTTGRGNWRRRLNVAGDGKKSKELSINDLHEIGLGG